jgi:dephospho-CoA kinase
MLAGLRERLADLRAAGHRVVALEAAVLDRMGARDLVDCAVLVTAPAEERIRRLVAAGLAPEEARRRVELHRALGLETPLCDYVLDNGGTVAALRAQARELLGKVEARAGGGTRSVARGRPLCYNRAGGER